jgi:head-tail adaptor
MSNTQRNIRITVQKPVLVRDAVGGQTTTWEDVASVYARKLNSKGREFYSGGLEIGAQDAGFQVLQQEALQPMDQTWRIVHGTVLWNVYSVDAPVGDKRITILCKAGSNRG